MAVTLKWNFEAEHIQSCNCDFGCPCNFNEYPTTGNCEALLAYRIRKGQFGNTKFDGATFAAVAWWPCAIHEGKVTPRLYVNPKINKEQVERLGRSPAGRSEAGS